MIADCGLRIADCGESARGLAFGRVIGDWGFWIADYGKGIGCRTWIRTMTSRFRVCCATVTPFGKKNEGSKVTNLGGQSSLLLRAGKSARRPAQLIANCGLRIADCGE